MAVQATLIVPVVAAVIALVLEEGPGSRTGPTLLMLGSGVAAGFAGVLAATGHEVRWQGFDADAWRGLLAAGLLLVAAGGIASARTAGERAAFAIGAGTAAGAIFAPDLLGVGALLVVSSAAFAVAAIVARPHRRALLRTLTPLLVSDACALIALSTAAGTSLTFAPLGAVPGALLLAAAAIRLTPLPGWTEDASAGGTATVWLGPARAHGALLAMLAIAGSPARGTALMIVAAVVAAVCALRLTRDANAISFVAVPAAIAAAGLGFGGAVATAGAAIALSALFAAGALDRAGRPSVATPVLAFAPAAGALAGFVLAGGAIWRVAAARPVYLPVALALAAAAGVAAVTAWRIRDPEPEVELEIVPEVVPAIERENEFGLEIDGPADDHDEEIELDLPTRPRGSWAPLLVAAAAVLVALAPAVAPMFSHEHGAAFVAAAAGTVAPLTDAPEVFSEGLGVAVAALILVGLIAAGRIGGDAPMPSLPPPNGWMKGWASAPALRDAPPTRAALLAAAVPAVVAVVFCIRLVLVAGGRGWL